MHGYYESAPVAAPFINESAFLKSVVVTPKFKDRNGRVTQVVLALPAPKEGENQKVFHLGGCPRAFLRVNYYVQPRAEDRFNDDHEIIGSDIFGVVLPKEAEYLLEVTNEAFECLAEYNYHAEMPLSLRRLETELRPDAKALGWGEDELRAWLGDETDDAE